MKRQSLLDPRTAFAGVWLQERLHLLQEAKGQGSNTRLIASVTGLSLRMLTVCDKQNPKAVLGFVGLYMKIQNVPNRLGKSRTQVTICY